MSTRLTLKISRAAIWGGLMLLLLVLAACNGEAAEESNPDTAPTATQPAGQEVTPTRRATLLPPTWTATPEGFIATNAPSPTRTPFEGRGNSANTLPPTWTATPEGFVPTERPSATPVGGSAAQTTPRGNLPPTWTPRPTEARQTGASSNPGRPGVDPTREFFDGTLPPVEDLCYLFAADGERNVASAEVFQGNPVTVFWFPIPSDVYSYRFELFHPSGDVIVSQELPPFADSIELLPDTFNTSGFIYGWQVTPLLNFEPTCFSIAGEIYIIPTE